MKKIRLLFLTLVALIAGAASSSAKTVYFQPNDNWRMNDARFALYMCVSGVEGGEWTDFAIDDADNNIYVATFNDDYPNMIICRMNPETEENNFDEGTRWNQTGDLDAPDADNLLYILAAGQWSGATVGNGLTTEDHTNPLLLDYYVEGDVALISAGWKATDANKMTVDGDHLTFTAENVLLVAGTSYGYKVYGNDAWYPSGDNATVSVETTGFYNVTFTFDLTTPTATATLVSEIGYLIDFNTAFSTSNHDFVVAPMWKHIVDSYDDNYVSYSYREDEGLNGTGCLLVYDQNKRINYDTRYLYDLLVTPKVSGTIRLKVKVCISADATSYKNAFVQLYSLNASATEKDELLKEFKTEIPGYNSGSGDWVELTYEVGSTPQRIGIRAQYVYMDNFIADAVDNSPEPALSVSAVMNSDGATGAQGTNPAFAQQEDGTMKVNLKVTLSNTGNVDFVAGTTENYTLTPATDRYGTKTYYDDATIAIPEDLAAGESKTFDVEFITPYVSGYNNWYIRENVTGTTSSSYRYASSAAYEPIFVFREAGSTSTSSLYGDIAFGKITEETSKSYEIYNDGTAPLQVKTITVPEGFTVDNAGNFTVAAKEKQVITITLPVTTPGIFSGNLEIVYVDKTGADVSYPKAVTGTVLDATKNIITFDDGQGNAYYPQGSVRYNAYISSEGIAPDKNYYLQGSTPNPLYITPLMTAEAGESIAFDAENSSSYSNGKVEVMISTDRTNWTTIQTISNIASNYNWTTYTATIPEAGNYYLGFKLTSSKVDNIYGLVYAPAPAHDLLLIGSDVPATAKQNADYTAKVKVGNVGPNAEAAGTYTASLYVDGEEVATANDVALPVANISGNYNNGEEENYTVLTFTYKPHTPGTFPAYIEVKAGDVTLTTEEVELVIAEEKVEAELGLETNGTNGSTPLNLNYNNSESVSLYTAAVLKDKLELKDGDKISSITFKGYKTADEHSTLLSVYYQWTDETELSAPADAGLLDVSGMTPYVENELHTWAKAGSSSELADMYVMNFSEPLVYEEGKALRIVMRSLNQLNGSNYKQVYWEKSTVYQNPSVSGTYLNYRHYTDTSKERDSETNYTTSFESNWSYEYLPAIHLALVVEPTVLAGTVTDANGAVEGATVTLRNEANDVEYSGTTNADGQYEINVIQDQLTYIAVADAEGLVAPVQVVDGFDASVNFELAEPAYGDIWSGDAANAAITAGYFKYLAQGGDRLLVSYTEEGAATKTIKFTKPNEWNAVYVYAWYGNGDEVSEWPGTKIADYSYLNEFGQQVYAYELPSDVVGIIFNDGAGQQTADITDFNVTGYYTDGNSDNLGHLNVFSWTDPSTTAIELLDVSGKVVATGTLNDGEAEIGLDGDVIAKLAKGIIVNVKATGATITNVELAEPTFYVLKEDATGVEAQESANVKIERSFKQGWNAIVLPFDLSANEIAETFGEDAEVAYFESAENVNGNVSISFKKGTSISHGTPYLLYLPEAKSDVSFRSKAVNDATEAVTGDAFNFVGVYEQTTVNTGDMFIKGGKFFTATTNNYVLPFRSYLQLKSDGVRSVSITIGEETITTAIDGLTIESNDNVIYNLGGQKVQNAKKGLYIINGKKVVVK